jgi:hypothetical protein
VYLLGMGIISWQGQYNGTGNLPFWWDMLTVAAFSLIVYYWSRASRLPRAKVQELLNRQAHPEDTEALAA